MFRSKILKFQYINGKILYTIHHTLVYYIVRSRLIKAVVPQGSMLGTVLFNLFVSDIPRPSEGELLLLYTDEILLVLPVRF